MEDVCGTVISTPVPVESGTYPDANCGGTKVYTYTYTDCAGLPSDWVYTYVIKRTTHPTVIADGGSTIQCESAVTAPTPPHATDVCGEDLTGQLTNTTTTGTSCNGTKTYTFTYTDCAGLTTVWNYVYTIQDDTPPTASNPAEVDVKCIGDIPSPNISVVTDAHDNCDPSPIVTFVQDVSTGNGSIASPYIVTRTYNVADHCGNNINVHQILKAIDNIVPTITCPSNVTVCQGQSIVLGTPTTGDNCEVASVTNNAPTWYSLGINSVTWTVTDIHGNTNTCIQTVTVYALPDAPTANNVTACYDGNAHTGSASSSYQIVWYASSTGSTPASQPSQTYPGTSTAWASARNAEGCESASRTQVTVTVNAKPTVSITAGSITCNGGTTTATASVSGGQYPYSYSWNTSPTTQTGATATGLVAGTYTVTVTDYNNCSNTASVTLTEPYALTVASTSFTTTATNGDHNVTFGVSASGGTTPYTYQWIKDGSSISGATSSIYSISTVSCSSDGVYSVNVTSNGCSSPVSSSSGTFTVFSGNAPSAATGFLVTGWTRSSITFNVVVPSANNGGYRMIVAQNDPTATSADQATSDLSWTPQQGKSYTSYTGSFLFTNTAYTLQTSGTGANTVYTQIVYNGTTSGTGSANSIIVSGLSRLTWYGLAVFEYKIGTGTGAGTCGNHYQTSAPFKRGQQTSSNKESEGDEPFAVQISDNFLMTEIAPNPAYNDINFSIITQEKLPFTFEIYSIEGMQVYSEQRELSTGTTPITISLKSEKGILPSGMYLLKVRTGTDEMTRRFIYVP
jgi:hypothetical protein